MPLDVCPVMRTESVELTKATHLQVKDEDATDSANITTQAYVEKYSAVITPSTFMKASGARATLVVEYIIKTDPAAGTVSVKTLVGGADTVEKTLLNIAAGKQTAVHTDILEPPLLAGTPITVSLEAKNSDAGQTSVIDYCNIYLQLGSSSVVLQTVIKLKDKESLSFALLRIDAKVWSGAVDTAVCIVTADELLSKYYKGLTNKSGSTTTSRHYDDKIPSVPVEDSIQVIVSTDNVDNPAVVELMYYNRVWFE